MIIVRVGDPRSSNCVCICFRMRGSRGFLSDRCFAKGQLWQVFVGSKERWVHGYYQTLLAQQAQVSAEANGIKDPTAVDDHDSTLDQQSSPHSNQSEKWRSQIEKVKGITSIEFYICMSFFTAG